MDGVDFIFKAKEMPHFTLGMRGNHPFQPSNKSDRWYITKNKKINDTHIILQHFSSIEGILLSDFSKIKLATKF